MGVEELITQFAHLQVSQETFTKLSEDKKNKWQVCLFVSVVNKVTCLEKFLQKISSPL